MKTFWIGVRIWLLALTMNAIIFSVFVAFVDPLIAIVTFFIGGFFGLILSVPVLTILAPMIDLAGKIPGSVNARIVWFMTLLTVIANLYLLVLNWMLPMVFETIIPIGNLYYVPVSMAIVFSVMFLRSYLRELYTERDKRVHQQLQSDPIGIVK